MQAEVARRAQPFYETTICQPVESEDNLGERVIINVEATGIEASPNLRRLFAICIGYPVAASLAGVKTRDC